LNPRFSIARRIGFGFGVFILVVGVVFYLTNSTLTNSYDINKRINEVYAPSIKVLEELDNQLVRSQQLMKHWAYVQRREDDRERLEAVRLCETVIPEQLQKIKAYSDLWQKDQLQHLDDMTLHIHDLLKAYADIRSTLPNWDSYYDPMNSMMVDSYFIEGGIILQPFQQARDKLKYINDQQRTMMSEQIMAMNESFKTLRVYLVYIAIIVIIAGIVIGFFTTRSIVVPVNTLRRKIVDLSKGVFTRTTIQTNNDEVGDMAKALTKLVDNLEMTREFSIQVGTGNFSMPFEPLSEQDELGKALLRMRDDLASYRNEMEEKVALQTVQITRQKEEVEAQRERVLVLYQDLQSSIDYAQRLQQTILPDDHFIKEMFPDSFVFFRPKATVSGDFYWFARRGNKKLFAAADCTGHGVPGAFMSLVGHNVLNQATKVYSKPAQILNSANRLSGEAMRSNDGEHFMRDGMDIALCALDSETLELEFSGAHNPAYILRNDEITEISSDPFSIGTYVKNEREFTNHKLQLQKGDCIYLFSDGYADQFGGPRGKKFMRKQFRTMLLSIYHLSMEEQKIRIGEILEQWRGDQEQIDDILVIGIRV
jgi:serine phosphatase RsbU (regulator of sigma subunit)